MKKLLLVFATMITLTAKSQTSVYYPFPEDSATWCTDHCSIQPPFGAWYNMASYKLDGKTLINGNWYSRMLHYEKYCNASFSFCACFQLNNTDTTTYYIRQDTPQKKVWIYIPATNCDTIFLDFNLNTGDTIDGRKEYWAEIWGLGTFAIVNSIDSVLIGTQYRTRYNYIYQTHGNSMIEGIGPDHGLFYVANQGYDYANALDIFSQNNQIFYPNYSPDTIGMGQFCYDFPTGMEELNQISFSISPNPVRNQITISLNQQPAKNMEITICDLMGKQIRQLKIVSQTTTINRNGLSNGMYFYQIRNDKRVFASGKLIME